jgi:hypothetical protein
VGTSCAAQKGSKAQKRREKRAQEEVRRLASPCSAPAAWAPHHQWPMSRLRPISCTVHPAGMLSPESRAQLRSGVGPLGAAAG